ncbi:hypothetical protein IP70_17840 [alpha proteobacterium AAP38]|nr:hypothetical protein IP70_17840 [alpha proteobacterium AAP38]
MAPLDVESGAAQRMDVIVTQRLALCQTQQAKKIAWLLPLVIIHPMIPMGCWPVDAAHAVLPPHRQT